MPGHDHIGSKILQPSKRCFRIWHKRAPAKLHTIRRTSPQQCSGARILNISCHSHEARKSARRIKIYRAMNDGTSTPCASYFYFSKKPAPTLIPSRNENSHSVTLLTCSLENAPV